MAKQYETKIAQWKQMDQGFPKEFAALQSAKDAMVKAIRAKHGPDAVFSFQRFSYGIPEGAQQATPKMLTSIDPAMLEALASMILAKASNGKGKRK